MKRSYSSRHVHNVELPHTLEIFERLVNLNDSVPSLSFFFLKDEDDHYLFFFCKKKKNSSVPKTVY